MSVAKQEAARVPPVARFEGVHPARALGLPLCLASLLFAFAWLPSARRDPALVWSFWSAGAALLVWTAALLAAALRRGRSLTLEVVPRSQHYVQACAQLSVFAYWGWYWRQVYDSADLIAAQLVFAYAFESLLVWSRRDSHTLGFGPFPIVLSINLFLWFKPEWFFLQFLLVALGFAAKELIRWSKDGRRVHVFNPSALPLSLFSVVLLLTGSTHVTWGQEIADTQLYPPYIYMWIFLAGLPGQLLFGVTLMTMSAVATTYALILLHAAAGTGFVFGTYIPIATFLGMHLLFTDPSTSPRSDLGRIAFGVLYGASVVATYAFLEHVGAHSFYDKLLVVPILNTTIQAIDRAVGSPALRRFDPTRLLAAWAPRRRYLAYVSVWALVFAVVQGQTRADQDLARHNRLGFASLFEGRVGEALSHFREAAERGDAVGQSNLGVLYATGEGVAKDDAEAVRWYRRGADQNYDAAQLNLAGMYARGEGVVQDVAEAARWYRRAAEQGNAHAQFALGALYTAGQGVLQDDAEAARWYRKAAEQGHAAAQSDLGVLHATGRGVPQDDAEAARWCRKAAEQGHAEAQFNLGLLHAMGRGVPQDDAEAARWYRKAAEQGNADAQYNLGFMHATGRGVPQDDAEAARWYRRAAEQGHAAALSRLDGGPHPREPGTGP